MEQAEFINVPLRDLDRVALLVGDVVDLDHLREYLRRSARSELAHVHHEGIDSGCAVRGNMMPHGPSEGRNQATLSATNIFLI